MIRLENVAFSYEKDKTVLENITLEIRNGESVGLIGANGAGKSTFMKLLLGLEFGSGRILVDDIEVRRDSVAEVRRKLGFVLQNSDNQMFMPTVYEDIMFGLLNGGMSRGDAEAKTDSVLSLLGLEELKHRHNHRISGGEKRMAAIATVLAMDPLVLLMDEPTSALDPYNRRRVINTIRSLPNTKIITSHDLDMILDTCTRVVLLSDGRIAADGPAEVVLRDRDLLEAHRMELPLRLQR